MSFSIIKLFTLITLMLILTKSDVTPPAANLPGLRSYPSTGETIGYGLAARYPGDDGLKADPAVIFASGFEDRDWYQRDFNYDGWLADRGYQIGDRRLPFSGSGVLEYQSIKGEHYPHVMNIEFPGQDEVYLRWYRQYQPGYDFSCQSKTNGVYARNSLTGKQNGKPTGTNKFSVKLQVWPDGEGQGELKFYTYHPEQEEEWGDTLVQNVGDPVKFETGRWYSLELMLKANHAGRRDGEIKLWIDGVLKGSYQNMRFRDANTLKINELNITAYVGGDCTAPQDQKVWDDNLVLATKYIGPLLTVQATSVLENKEQPSWSEY